MSLKKSFINKLKESKMDTSFDVSIIIVSYNVKDLLRDCLRSIYTQTKDISYEVFVVDNASSDGSVEMVEQEFQWIKLIENKENLGFAKANNIAIKHSKARYVLLLNPDTIVLDGALQKMVTFMKNYPDAGAVGPRVLNPDGTIQYQHLSEDAYSYSQLYYRFLSLFMYSKSIKGKINKLSVIDKYEETNKIGFLSGACLMISSKAINRTENFLDERFLMFSEDRDLCCRLKKRGYNIYLLPKVSIIHYEGASCTRNSFYNNIQFYRSRYLFYRKHFGLMRAIAFRSVTILSSIRDLIALAAKILLISPLAYKTRLSFCNRIKECITAILWSCGFSPFIWKR